MADFKLDGEQGLAATALLDEALQSDSTMESLIRELVWRRDMMNPAAGGDQKAAPLHPSPDEDDGGPEQFRRQEPYRKLVSEWLRETMGGVEADNVGKPEIIALVNLCERAASLHPSSVQAVDGDER